MTDGRRSLSGNCQATLTRLRAADAGDVPSDGFAFGFILEILLMKRAFLLTAVAFVVASPAFAAGGGCSTAPKSAWQSQTKLESMLKTDGLTVRQIKVEKGCYEVYATDKTGQRLNIAYNAETLQKLANAEAGAN